MIDAHFKYMLAAGLMDNSALRKIVIINPQATELARSIRSVIREDQFRYGAVELADKRFRKFVLSRGDLAGIGRSGRTEALTIVESGNRRLEAAEKGWLPAKLVRYMMRGGAH